MRSALIGISTSLMMLLVGCGGGSDADPAEGSTSAAPSPDPTTENVEEPDEPEPSEDVPAPTAGDACAVLDPAFLDDLLDGESTVFGTPYEFQEPVTAGPSDFCAWKEGSTSLTLQVTLEPTATSQIDDHSGRAYNLDVEPVPVPQDGPGTSAVLLTDPAFEGSGQGDFAYGYFFVLDDVTVFVESVGLDLGASNLRAMADEAATRLAAG